MAIVWSGLYLAAWTESRKTEILGADALKEIPWICVYAENG